MVNNSTIINKQQLPLT